MNLARAWRFGRHIPPGKIARRAWLHLLRAARDRGFFRLSDRPAPLRADWPPLPLFAPRASAQTRGESLLTFRFLGREVAFAGRVDWRTPGEGQLWRMNLHYMEWLEGLPAEATLGFMRDWVDANPPERSGAWMDAWNSYALSIRVVVWMQRLAKLGLADEAVARSLAQQLRFLERNLETDLGGNHLIKNIKALLWAGAFFDGAEAARWRALGLGLLDRELAEQILPDGVHYERSPSYHFQVFADLVECRQALGTAAPRALDMALALMARASSGLVHPDGSVAEFNDAGLTMAYAPAEVLAVAGVVAPHITTGPDTLPLDGGGSGRGPPPEKSQTFTPTPALPHRGGGSGGDIALPAAGYFGRRRGGDYLLIDAGALAPDDLPAHGHGDLLSFEWSVAGRRIIVDPGVFEYVDGPKRKGSRSAASHNTLCFEGTDQAEFFGAFRIGRRPQPEVRRLAFSPDAFAIEAGHDGFAPWGLRHVRALTLEGDALRIVDRVEGGPRRRAEIGFLLHPDVRMEGSELALGATRIRFASSAPWEMRPAVWWPDMGVELPTSRLVVTVDPSLSEVITTFAVTARGS